jgi:hypothetical protein
LTGIVFQYELVLFDKKINSKWPDRKDFASTSVTVGNAKMKSQSSGLAVDMACLGSRGGKAGAIHCSGSVK